MLWAKGSRVGTRNSSLQYRVRNGSVLYLTNFVSDPRQDRNTVSLGRNIFAGQDDEALATEIWIIEIAAAPHGGIKLHHGIFGRCRSSSCDLVAASVAGIRRAK
jgi:hypothetical protein